MKTLKGQFVLSIITAILFVIGSFYYIEITGNSEYLLVRIMYYFAMIFSVFNAGLLTQKFIQTKKDD
ncbi:hypothetical protein D4T97_006500 [Siminovitchia acidinfaciens]|uniref:Uncharacterized protein n=1 Tax=Siminovitchia acidinfaciens TaxID=2321395 RepID=A0A429Y4Q5_9BACI|nr:hypothetical protein [Siminovitchia acidinfaciens]RST76412.1 hypothetical protein D4T97_006500 [Siminovitchia acidinfaciens]